MKKMLRGVKEESMLRAIIMGTLICVAISLVGAAILTSAVLGGTVEWSSVHVYALIMLAPASFLGTVTAGKMAGGKYAIVAGAVSGIYMLILLVSTIFFFDGAFDNVIGNIVSVLVGAGTACAICIRIGSGARGKKRAFR